MRSANTHRRLAVVIVTLTVLAPVTMMAQPASAFPPGDSVIAFNYIVQATAHIAKANLTMSPPPGVFKGQVDLDLGKLKGNIYIPPTSFSQSLAGPLSVTATAAIVSTKPVTGTVKLANFKITATSTFNIRILTMYVDTPAPPTLPSILGLPPIALPPLPVPKINLVGNNCVTASPISVTMSGIAHIGAPSTFNGTFTIPQFKSCSLATTLLNQEVPGPGNTFSATATPPPD
jgi:hypothetical protein